MSEYRPSGPDRPAGCQYKEMRISHIIRESIITAAVSICLLSVQSCLKDNVDGGLHSKPIEFETVMTRDAELTDASLNSFKVTAFIDDAGSTQFMKDEEVVLTSGKWTYSPMKYWPHLDQVHFMAYSTSLETNPKIRPDFVKVGDKFQSTFNYTLPSPENTANSTDAENQPDIVFAFRTGRTEADGSVSFAFSHALTAIQFKVGSVLPNTTLQKIELFKIPNKATCVVTGASDDTISFSWTLQPDFQRIDYVQSYDSLALTDEMVISEVGSPTTFMMIPQTLDDKAHLRLYVEVDGVSQTRQVSLEGTTWLPGEIHTYTISLD